MRFLNLNKNQLKKCLHTCTTNLLGLNATTHSKKKFNQTNIL